MWRDIVGSERDKKPGERLMYALERFTEDACRRALGRRALKEVLARCRSRDAEADYAPLRRSEIDAAGFAAEVRRMLPDTVRSVGIATPRGLVPRQPWMSDEMWRDAWRGYVAVMTNRDGNDRGRARASYAWLLGEIPFEIAQFELPARCAFPHGLVHAPLMGELAEFLAYAVSLCAGRDLAAAERACAFVALAAKAPPLVVAAPDGAHLIFIAAD
jgi:hypothetical protein